MPSPKVPLRSKLLTSIGMKLIPHTLLVLPLSTMRAFTLVSSPYLTKIKFFKIKLLTYATALLIAMLTKLISSFLDVTRIE